MWGGYRVWKTFSKVDNLANFPHAEDGKAEGTPGDHTGYAISSLTTLPYLGEEVWEGGPRNSVPAFLHDCDGSLVAGI